MTVTARIVRASWRGVSVLGVSSNCANACVVTAVMCDQTQELSVELGNKTTI